MVLAGAAVELVLGVAVVATGTWTVEAEAAGALLITVPTTAPAELYTRVAHDDGFNPRLRPGERPHEVCAAIALALEMTAEEALELDVDGPTMLPKESMVYVIPEDGSTDKRRPFPSDAVGRVGTGMLVMLTLRLGSPKVKVAHTDIG